MKSKIWKPVTSEDQLEQGSIVKIVGTSDSYSHTRITVKKVIDIGSAREILLKKKGNLYFNLTAYLHWKKTGEITTVGKWVKELYVKI